MARTGFAEASAAHSRGFVMWSRVKPQAAHTSTRPAKLVSEVAVPSTNHSTLTREDSKASGHEQHGQMVESMAHFRARPVARQGSSVRGARPRKKRLSRPERKATGMPFAREIQPSDSNLRTVPRCAPAPA